MEATIADRAIELLAPAKDLTCGRAAVDCGADAVYIGAPRFGAREAAGNALDDIAALVEYSHRYYARVYVTVNTLLADRELAEAVRLIEQVHAIGADGVIVQDVGLLECALPPIPLIASTQMHNDSPGKVAFLEQVGFRRAILARELTIDEIRAIRRAAPGIELECFIHGALCVCYSGQCYLSYAWGGRSGNRGECAQPCRKVYTLVDRQGNVLARDRHLLSLRDLNLSEHLGVLLDAGVTSFKIEGRLKDRAYVANVVAHYRARLDEILAARGLRKASSGAITPGFEPTLSKTFNRGYTTYFLYGRTDRIGSIDTPKMIGEHVGRVKGVSIRGFILDREASLRAGDGICYFDRAGVLRGSAVNAAEGRTFIPENGEGIERGTEVFRNYDHAFTTALRHARPRRRIAVQLTLAGTPNALTLEATDEDDNRVCVRASEAFEPATDPDQARAYLERQLAKTGDTIFACREAMVEASPAPFIPAAAINALRRAALDALLAEREANRPRCSGAIAHNDAPYPAKALTYLGNVLNKRAREFYRRHGVEEIEPAAESGLAMRGCKVMAARYCVRHQLGLCAGLGAPAREAEPLRLIDEQGRQLELRFDCARCQMEVYLL